MSNVTHRGKLYVEYGDCVACPRIPSKQPAGAGEASLRCRLSLQGDDLLKGADNIWSPGDNFYGGWRHVFTIDTIVFFVESTFCGTKTLSQKRKQSFSRLRKYVPLRRKQRSADCVQPHQKSRLFKKRSWKGTNMDTHQKRKE